MQIDEQEILQVTPKHFMSRPLRILMILHMPWTPNLGAPRVQYEIAEEWRELGYVVDKFDLEDAFPHRNKLTAFFESSLFARRAIHFVRQHGEQYDIIDAHRANLTISKQQLGFKGLLAVRSSGLGHFYRQYEQSVERNRRQRGEKSSGSFLGNYLRQLARLLGPTLADYEKSFAHADVITVPNQDEYHYVTQTLGWKNKTVMLHHGLREEKFLHFKQARMPVANRLASQQIVFIGHWGERKGARDFPQIVRQVRQASPSTTFLMLGTGHSSKFILSNFDPVDLPHIKVTPFFDQQDLPELLSHATVGIFPSYCEAFGWAILEQLAAGIPVIAYEESGPKEMLKHFSLPLMVSKGEVSTIAQKLLEVLQLSLVDYTVLTEQSCQIAAQFKGQTIARKLLQVYENKLEQIYRS